MANLNSEANGSASGESRVLSTAIYRVQVAGRTLSIAITERQEGAQATTQYVQVGDGPVRPLEILAQTADGGLSVLVDGVVLHGLVGQRGKHGLAEDAVTVVVGGQTLEAVVQDERTARLASAAAAGRPHSSVTAIRAPMPGLVVAVPVAVGEQVARGTTLVVLSAMKMQNELTAPADGTVTEIAVSAGQTVDQNQVLVRLE